LKDEIINVGNDVTGIEKNKEVTFPYYPNPVSEKLWLTGNEKIKTVKIFNITGKMIEFPVLSFTVCLFEEYVCSFRYLSNIAKVQLVCNIFIMLFLIIILILFQILLIFCYLLIF